MVPGLRSRVPLAAAPGWRGRGARGAPRCCGNSGLARTGPARLGGRVSPRGNGGLSRPTAWEITFSFGRGNFFCKKAKYFFSCLRESMTRASEPRRLGGWAPRSPSPSLALGPALGLANPRPAGPLPSRGAACEPVGSGCAGLRGPARGIGRLPGGVLRGRGGLRPLTLAPAPRVSLPACLTPAGPTLAPDSPAVPWAPTGLGAAPPVLSLCEARVAPLLSPPPLPRSVCPQRLGPSRAEPAWPPGPAPAGRASPEH